MSSNNAPRKWLDEQLKALLPDDWRVIDEQRVPQTLSETTVIIKYLKMTRLPAAPKGALWHEFIVTIAAAYLDQGKAEDELDDTVLELVTALDQLKQLTWTSAEKVLVADRYLGWDITVQTLSAKEPT